MIRTILWCLGALVALVTIALSALWFEWERRYVDETIVEGSRWGVRIGASKAETLEGLQRSLGGRDFQHSPFLLVSAPSSNGFPRWEVIGLLHDVSLPRVEDEDGWIVSWTDEAFSELMLRFDNELLTSAHMKARAFELP